MSDGRSQRRAKVIPFIDRLERDRNANLQALVSKAQLLKLDGFESVKWHESNWKITSGRLVKLTGKNIKAASFVFTLSPKLGAESLVDSWGEVCKALFVLRFHRKHQSTPNQRNFITAVGYVAAAATQLGQELLNLTPEALDNACALISKHYREATAYNLHKHIAEFAAHCDANGLCRVLLQFKYARMKRPASTDGLSHKRLDDPEVIETKSDKLVDPKVFRVMGELYQNVPKIHKYRLYVLLLTLLACTGRRFSEVSLLPNQTLSVDDEGNGYIEYFPRKTSRGDVFTPKRKLYLPSEVKPIVEEVLNELADLTAAARETAEEMHKTRGPDLRFLEQIPSEQRLYASDIKELGISDTGLTSTGWLRKQNLAWPDVDARTKQGQRPRNPIHFTNKEGLKKYCARDFSGACLSAIHTDQFGKEYYLKDLLFLRPLGLSSGTYAHWLATSCSQSMFSTFLRYFPDLAAEYASASVEVDFTSHHFRHTLNTLLDEGGLSDLLQTEWFGRTNSRDTKAYQHTSREKRALMLRQDIKKGLVGGQIAEQIQAIPVDVQDVFLKARVQAVHDVGTGICIHNFSQTPCERHLQCSADCKDYVWAKGDAGRLEDLKRQYALTAIARKNAEQQMSSQKPKKSADWLAHNDKKLKTLKTQLADNGVEHFDPEQYLIEVKHG
ncbi:TPA: integrase [Escherichia coli]|nr:integrase [Escherichia coli]HAY4757260.1 integrase [Escherichia coli]HAY5066579.1 integrase [Escherichia coli]